MRRLPLFPHSRSCSRLLRPLLVLAVAAALTACGPGGSSDATDADGGASDAGVDGGSPPWLIGSRVEVQGVGVTNTDCRTTTCQHNENTDLTLYKGAIYLVHRTARSQELGPDSALHVLRSTDGGRTFTQVANLPAPAGRDVRDPHFYQVGDELFIKCITRLPSMETRDADTDSISMMTRSSDGASWSDFTPIGPETWSFWRPREHDGVWYSAAYHDGDTAVSIFSSTDGLKWTQGAAIYSDAADTPLETELVFMPSGRMLALARTDGADQDLTGDIPADLKTRVCWAMPPYDQFDCTAEFDGQRLDGPLAFFWKQRLFVVARKHLGADGRKRTALFEITGTSPAGLDGGPLAIKEWGELPSAGDTSYAGVVPTGDDTVLVSWYSGSLALDETWLLGMYDATDIRLATIDLSKLQ